MWSKWLRFAADVLCGHGSISASVTCPKCSPNFSSQSPCKVQGLLGCWSQWFAELRKMWPHTVTYRTYITCFWNLFLKLRSCGIPWYYTIRYCDWRLKIWYDLCDSMSLWVYDSMSMTMFRCILMHIAYGPYGTYGFIWWLTLILIWCMLWTEWNSQTVTLMSCPCHLCRPVRAWIRVDNAVSRSSCSW